MGIQSVTYARTIAAEKNIKADYFNFPWRELKGIRRMKKKLAKEREGKEKVYLREPSFWREGKIWQENDQDEKRWNGTKVYQSPIELINICTLRIEVVRNRTRKTADSAWTIISHNSISSYHWNWTFNARIIWFKKRWKK